MSETFDYQKTRRRAAELLDDGNAHEAFKTFRAALEFYPPETDAQFADALGVFARIAKGVVNDEWAATVRAAAADPNDVQALYDLGYALIEQQLHGIAATVLGRAHRLAPGAEVVLTEYVCALEGNWNNAEALRVIEASPASVRKSPVVRYQHAFNALMCTDLTTPRRFLHDVGPSVEADESLGQMAAYLAGLIRRADAVRGVTPLDESDLRGWHFVMTGGLLTSLLSCDEDDGMNGRHAFLQDSDGFCREGIERVDAVLRALGMRPPRVYAAPDRASTILATATARVLGLPLMAWPAATGAKKPGLIVAYDLSRLEGEALAGLAEHRPGQVLWSHAASWTTEPPFAADLVTLVYEYLTSPWEAGRLRVDRETNQAVMDPAATGAVEKLAGQVVAAPVDESALADAPKLLSLAEAARTLTGDDAGGVFRTSGTRRRQRTDSPVKSSRFL